MLILFTSSVHIVGDWRRFLLSALGHHSRIVLVHLSSFNLAICTLYFHFALSNFLRITSFRILSRRPSIESWILRWVFWTVPIYVAFFIVCMPMFLSVLLYLPILTSWPRCMQLCSVCIALLPTFISWLEALCPVRLHFVLAVFFLYFVF